jgi:hypothetical protein
MISRKIHLCSRCPIKAPIDDKAFRHTEKSCLFWERGLIDNVPAGWPAARSKFRTLVGTDFFWPLRRGRRASRWFVGPDRRREDGGTTGICRSPSLTWVKLLLGAYPSAVSQWEMPAKSRTACDKTEQIRRRRCQPGNSFVAPLGWETCSDHDPVEMLLMGASILK